MYNYKNLNRKTLNASAIMEEPNIALQQNIFSDLPEKVEIIAKFNGNLLEISNQLDAEIEILSQGYAIITIDKKRIPQLYTYPQIEHLELPKILYFESSFNLISSCIKSVQSGSTFNLSGKGVIVAIIDSGIDYTHKDFQNPDSTSRIQYIWDQTADGTPPAGFYSGAEFNNSQINQALQSLSPLDIVPSVDTNGHGTAVAGIAAGNGRESNGVDTGVATEADIIVVKVGTRGYTSFARSTEIMRALKYVIDKATALNKPISINMSFGMNNGSHKGESLFETYITEISNNWKTVISVPTGNEGSAGHHYWGQIESNQVKEIEFFTAEGLDYFYITFWKDFSDALSVEIIFPNGSSSGVVGIENQTKTVRQENFDLTVIYGQPSHYSSSQEIFFNFKAVNGRTIPSGVWKLRIISGTIVDGNFEMWLPTIEEVTDDTFFSNPFIYGSLTIPSTASKVISVAGYNDRVGNIAEFSGRGSINTSLPNPDIAAPAVNIITVKAGGGYDSFTGTSFAAPFVTGSAALMMQWGIVNGNDPFLYGEKVKAFLRLGATRQRGVIYPNPSFGYGNLCLQSTMDYLLKYSLGGFNIWQSL
ncbi:MAG: S8 family peptidase [Candidatus Metalachnospira sp.]|nr:S8 family peptidase [Candidatus Metalachnospira sp.]